MSFSAGQDFFGSGSAPNFTGGAAGTSSATGGKASASTSGDIITGKGTNGFSFPSLYKVGAAMLLLAIIYKIAKSRKK
jgi:hypothetical protein